VVPVSRYGEHVMCTVLVEGQKAEKEEEINYYN
jgi:hypothetical protein